MAGLISGSICHFSVLVFLAILLYSLIGWLGLPWQTNKQIALFSFGDVIFDQGNNNYLNTSGNRLRANFPPYGDTYFKYPQGRFSDGRLISDFIAEYAGLPLILPYLNPANDIYNYIYGSNFASGGSTALEETRRGQVVTFQTQIEYYQDVVNKLRQQLGNRQASRIVSNAVHLLSIGNSDYLSLVLTPSPLYDQYTREEYMEIVIGNITAAVTEIYKAGGRKFGFMSLGTLGCFPNVRQLNNGNCNESITALADLHNKAFPLELKKLEKQLPDFKYSYFDYHAVATAIINNPSKYGFKVVDKGCCGTGPYHGDLTCGRQKEYESCDNPSEYVFFDAGHATEAANELYAKIMWSVVPNITGPYSLKSLFEIKRKYPYEDFIESLSIL